MIKSILLFHIIYLWIKYKLKNVWQISTEINIMCTTNSKWPPNIQDGYQKNANHIFCKGYYLSKYKNTFAKIYQKCSQVLNI